MSVETWKPVVGYEGKYEVSDLGRVRSVTRTITQLGRGGVPFSRGVVGRVLRPGVASNGYPTVAIGRYNTRTVHSLVAEAFLGPCPAGCEVLHLDGTRTNSVLSNLRYGTRSENIYDAVRNGSWMSEARTKHCKKLRSYRADSSL